jgi:hypothetical protein
MAWSCGACSAPNSNVTVYVDAPSLDGGTGADCIGVVGFEITMNGPRGHWASGPLLDVSPVLDPAGCRIARPFSVTDLSTDGMLTVSVVGYDSAHAARVSGTAQLASLSGPPVHVPLAAIAGSKPTVLLIDRAPLLGGAALGDVTRMVVATQMRPQTLLDLDTGNAAVAPYFSATDPGAFLVEALPDTSLTIDFTLRQGTTVPRARLVATPNGSYWQTQAR